MRSDVGNLRKLHVDVGCRRRGARNVGARVALAVFLWCSVDMLRSKFDEISNDPSFMIYSGHNDGLNNVYGTNYE